MDDTWRFVLAIVLSTIVMVLYFVLFPTPKKKAQVARKAPQVQEKKEVASRAPAVIAPFPKVEKGDVFSFRTDYIAVEFSRKGGFINSIILKKYFYDLDKKVPYAVIQNEPWGILSFDGKTDEDTQYSVETKGNSVIFTSGSIEKVYTFCEKPYSIKLEVRGAPKGFSVLSFFKEKPKEKHYRMSKKLVFLKKGSVQGKKMKFFRKHPDTPFTFSSVDSVGVDEGYFLLTYYGGSFSGEARVVGNGYIALKIFPETGSFSIFSGPKMEEILAACGNSLNKMLSFGVFTILAKPLLKFMKLTHRFTKNYGLDILLLTLLIKIVFFPLSHISFKSMKEMQKLQPVIEQLKKKYKDDKERLNRELIQMYRRHKVNPLGGCLPILIQIPVFFALYDVLLYAVEFRHAPFFLWIRDLSARDPYYITPIIMGATMVLQQKLTPTSSDPTQSKLMYGMAIVFTVMFASFPSGLVIYWTFNNILSIFQQLYTLRKV